MDHRQLPPTDAAGKTAAEMLSAEHETQVCAGGTDYVYSCGDTLHLRHDEAREMTISLVPEDSFRGRIDGAAIPSTVWLVEGGQVVDSTSLDPDGRFVLRRPISELAGLVLTSPTSSLCVFQLPPEAQWDRELDFALPPTTARSISISNTTAYHVVVTLEMGGIRIPRKLLLPYSHGVGTQIPSGGTMVLGPIALNQPRMLLLRLIERDRYGKAPDAHPRPLR